MLLKFNLVYKRKAMRKIMQFIKPKISRTEDWQFPMNSLLHWAKLSDLPSFIARDTGCFRKDKVVVIETITEYKLKDEESLGIYRRDTKKLPVKIISSSQQKEKTFKFLKIKQKIRLTDKMLLVYNYGFLNSMYLYAQQVMLKAARYNNFMCTLMNRALETERYKFILLYLPKELLSKAEYNKYSVRLNNSSLKKKFLLYEHLHVLELWKFLTPELTNKSMFGKIPKDQWNNVNLMLVIDTKLVLLNLGFLASLVKEMDHTFQLPGINNFANPKLKSHSFRLLFYKFLQEFINQAAYTEEELEKIEQEEEEPNTQGSGKGKSVNTGNVTEEEMETIASSYDTEDEEVDEDEDDSTELDEDGLPTDEIDDNADDDVDTLGEIRDAMEGDSTIYDKATLDDINNEANNYGGVIDKVKSLKENKILSKKQQDDLISAYQMTLKAKDPFGSKMTIEQLLDPKLDDLSIKEDDVSISDNIVVFDKNFNKNITNTINKSYINKQLNKDILRSVFSLQNADSIVTNYNVTNREDILGATQEHVVTLKTVNNKINTIKFTLPVIKEDGTFKLSGNTYLMRKQKADLPVRKIDRNVVNLSSYYGKVKIIRAYNKANDTGYKIANHLLKMNNDQNIDLKNLVLLELKQPDCVLPSVYGIFGRYIRSFDYQDYYFCFEYKKRNTIMLNKDDALLQKLESNGSILVGRKGKDYIIMDQDSRLFVYKGNKFEEIDGLYTLLDIDYNNLPIEYVTLRILKNRYPVVILLSYYIGLKNLIRILGVKFKIDKPDAKPRLEHDEYGVRFKDMYLILKRDYGKGDLLLSGLLAYKDIFKTVNINCLNSKDKFSIVFSKLEMALTYVNEVKLLENMFIDPVCLELLKQLNMPTSFKGLLIKAAEMLVDDNYVNPNDLSGMYIRGYERISGMVYKELITQLKLSNNRSHFSKSKLEINPNTIMNNISQDNTKILVDDLNPMAIMKMQDDVSALGAFGRAKEGMSKETRELNPSEVGVISEAGKDSGDVGISTYLSANPSFTSVRGTVQTGGPLEPGGYPGVLSPSALLSPFGNKDDAPRMNFASIMNSHIIPMTTMKAPYVRTGYEAIVPIRAPNKFVVSAEDDGKVISVSNKAIEVEYATKGKVKYKIESWTTKEESGACYTHPMKTDLKKGDSFTKDDTIVYDSLFFEPDVFNPKRVIYKQGNVVTVAFMENTETHEDSAGISTRLNKLMGTKVTKTISIVVEADDTILNLVKPGDQVKVDTILFTITDDTLLGGDLDERSLKILQDLKSSSPKAKVEGTVTKVEIRYNGEVTEFSKSLQEYIKISDQGLIERYGYPGKVNASYSINGKSLMENQIEIKTYIEYGLDMGVGDKAILGNQMKFTVGEIYEQDLITDDGTVVDLVFSNRSMANRIVSSPMLMGTTSMLLHKLGELATKTYFGE